ncbi:MAG: glucose 1-dehydrogenase [OM182 bacterium]|jgi:NAD(P)-dependent dehydrogenase (short-subunit alcohol dehydrogenase family)|uniref:3-oxoacyl-ACP reductase n=5 Tax=OM182 clade TaxID=745002 RepID=A0A0R2SEK6_9GAMM|nr:MAG: 3-oxoacyl-ACP reductase [OM182 bacterium BACL3 MAG-120507-bin80]KRO80249.1 MAG: 3-oxoacyl-ACP reductase [OM182 bacterium BACL3 MAG-120920-bin41]KRO83299.1 MAG: 3-oxoacyl-ACP reductase [OM182 bacterium BACL3 MAG-120619-bin3]KRP27095.1 MAG: 3-oxoacyl-ACP reductase [OM182 bacterium BACL3 MAG-120924-bin41]KRP34845.1 MAG: 3-oxoacyl-ACP reductase [OM182 bacterium BACL3 MAG-121001-bin29]KRP36843.1 MAG: 3-oxoacyl-ACP reductase [OM182 bacterium BACL3 MAG-120531-bin86]MBT3521284.1 glucose 1-deh|tara:strand:- start:310 stop:1101 length:792 start_codon:yes stop_codon:yes gene_type:complete
MTLAINDLFSVAGKVAIVTGGSRGIGRMIAEGFVENGVRTYITARKADACAETAAELSKKGECIALPADLSTKEGREAFVAEITAREAKIDILVNNAGAAWGAPFEEYPDEGYDKVMDINVKAIFTLTRDLMPLLKQGASQQNPSRVINIGSIDGLRVSTMDNFAYGASKAAVHFLTKNLALRLGPKGVTVNAIAPGAFQSNMMNATLEKFQDKIESENPLGRIGSPEDMAGLALYLASNASKYMTGQVIALDGGRHIGARQD